MPEWRVLSGNEVCEILEGQGFFRARQRGSHIIMKHPGPPITRTVPVPNTREIPIGTLRSIVRQSQVPTALFQLGN